MHIHLKSIIFIFLILFSAEAQLQAQKALTLQEAFQAAKENNPDLKAEYLNIRIAETDVATAQIRPNPSIEAEMLPTIRPRHFAPNRGWLHSQNRKDILHISKPMQIAGQRKNRIDAAEKNVTLNEKNYLETERALLSEVAEKWLTVWSAQQQLGIIQSAKNNIDSLLIANRARYKNQVITLTDLNRTEMLTKQYEIQLKSAWQNIFNSQKELKLLLGIQEDISVDTTDNLLFSVPEDIEALLNEAMQNRSDIQSAKALSSAAESNIKLQKSFAYPQPEVGFIFEGEEAVPFIGITASIDLPFFNRNQGEIQKSHLLKEQADNQLISVQNQIRSEISIALDNYALQQENMESFGELLNQSRSVLENVRYTYIRGGTTIIDFLEAQRNWIETQQQYYETMQKYRQSYIQLLYATGLINQLAQ